MSVTPFKVDISDSELELLKRKLDLARLPTNISNEQWGEKNGVTFQLMSETLDFWRTKYNWRHEEALINELPQFATRIEVDDFGPLNIHFVHSKSSHASAIPLLFIHGWPGSFLEVGKILPELNNAGFDLVAPSLPGYGFSSYTDKSGFKNEHHAKTMHQVMLRLGYQQYVVQGGDWGSSIARCVAILYPDHVKAMHVNLVVMPEPQFEKKPEYSTFERTSLERRDWFGETESAYFLVQGSKPRTLGFAMHDSPVGMLAWMTDKLFIWTDDYPWTPTELITWTLMHYFPGPTTGLAMYHENLPPQILHTNLSATHFVQVPTGVSAFPKELGMVPRSWAERKANVVFWQEHASGGHFAAYERPIEFVGDLIKFYREVWKV